MHSFPYCTIFSYLDLYNFRVGIPTMYGKRNMVSTPWVGPELVQLYDVRRHGRPGGMNGKFHFLGFTLYTNASRHKIEYKVPWLEIVISQKKKNNFVNNRLLLSTLPTVAKNSVTWLVRCTHKGAVYFFIRHWNV